MREQNRLHRHQSSFFSLSTRPLLGAGDSQATGCELYAGYAGSTTWTHQLCSPFSSTHNAAEHDSSAKHGEGSLERLEHEPDEEGERLGVSSQREWGTYPGSPEDELSEPFDCGLAVEVLGVSVAGAGRRTMRCSMYGSRNVRSCSSWCSIVHAKKRS